MRSSIRILWFEGSTTSPCHGWAGDQRQPSPCPHPHPAAGTPLHLPRMGRVHFPGAKSRGAGEGTPPVQGGLLPSVWRRDGGLKPRRRPPATWPWALPSPGESRAPMPMLSCSPAPSPVPLYPLEISTRISFGENVHSAGWDKHFQLAGNEGLTDRRKPWGTGVVTSVTFQPY